MHLSRRDFLELSAAGSLALALPLEAQARLPRVAAARVARGGARPRARAGRPRLRRRAARLQPALRRDPAAGGGARARHGRRAAVGALGGPATTCRWSCARAATRTTAPRRAARRWSSTSAASTASRLDGEVATVGPGLRNFDALRGGSRGAALAVPSGSCPNVALGGLATRRRHGARRPRARPDARPRHRARRRDRRRASACA